MTMQRGVIDPAKTTVQGTSIALSVSVRRTHDRSRPMRSMVLFWVSAEHAEPRHETNATNADQARKRNESEEQRNGQGQGQQRARNAVHLRWRLCTWDTVCIFERVSEYSR